MRFEDKVVIITGAGQGIGRVFAKVFAKEGATAVVADLNVEKAEAVVTECKDLGGNAIAVSVDVSDEQSVQSMVDNVMNVKGKIDILVNCAAIFSTIKMKPTEEITVDEWDKLMAVNLKGTWLCCKAVIPVMKAQKKGKIINMSSCSYLEGRPNYTHYISSKSGVLGITRGLARELGDWNITVNTIMPGAVSTEIPRGTVTPEQLKAMLDQRCIKRVEVPEDLVGPLFFFSSEESDFVTGQSLCVNGGQVMQ